MDDLIKALTVPFVAGFVVQRLLEIADPYTTAHIKDPLKKKEVMGAISLVIGVLLCVAARIGLLTILHQATAGTSTDNALPTGWWFTALDYLASGIFVSAGTDGFNSLLKFLSYKKDAAKVDAGNKLNAAGASDAVKKVNPQK
jgi:hypothetical protein